MSDILLLKERVINTINLGESHFREFKTALQGPPGAKKPRSTKDISREIAEALVAFANADGGELLIGVEDDGTITGLAHDEAEIADMLAAHKNRVHVETPVPLIMGAKVDLDGKLVLFFSVAKGSTEIYQLSDGRCIRRKDKETLPATFKQIHFERQEIRSREYDREFVDGAGVNDLDIGLVQSIANNFLRGLSIELYLQQAGLAEYAMNGLRLRRAALLLFAKDIQRWHPRSEVRILRIAGTQLHSGEHYNAISDHVVRGNIFGLLINAWDQLRPFLASKTEFGTDAKFEQKYIYPEWACREALVNAIAHRDYSISSGIEVYIYDDRLEIRNPGALLSTLTVESLEELQGAHESRNVLVARVLRENKYMRELGEGLKRMFELMEQSELQKPKLYSNRTVFGVSLFHSSVFTHQQELWLELFKAYPLSPNQKKIIVLGMEGQHIAPKDIYRAMNTSDRDTYDKEVTGLRNAGVLVEIRTNVQATQYSRKKNVKKSEVPRFKVEAPGKK
jgi:ATP-dependent DNA helicase RecG